MSRSRRLAKLEEKRHEAAKRAVMPVFISSDPTEPVPEGTRIRILLSSTTKPSEAPLPTEKNGPSSGEGSPSLPERSGPGRPRGQRPRQPTQEEIAAARVQLEARYLVGPWVGSPEMTPTRIVKRRVIAEALGVVKGLARRGRR